MKKHSIKLIAGVSLLAAGSYIQAMDDINKIDLSQLRSGLKTIQAAAQESILPILNQIKDNIEADNIDGLAQLGKDNAGQIASALGTIAQFAINNLDRLPEIIGASLKFQNYDETEKNRIVNYIKENIVTKLIQNLREIRNDLTSTNITYNFNLLAQALNRMKNSDKYQTFKDNVMDRFNSGIPLIGTLATLKETDFNALEKAAQELQKAKPNLIMVLAGLGVLRNKFLPAVTALLTIIPSLSIIFGNTLVDSGYIATMSNESQQRYEKIQTLFELIAKTASGLRKQLHDVNNKINELIGKEVQKQITLTVPKAKEIDQIPDIGVD